MRGQQVCTMICGRKMPSQKQIVKQRSKSNEVRYIALFNWYIKDSGHPGYDFSQVKNVLNLSFWVTETGQKTPIT